MPKSKHGRRIKMHVEVELRKIKPNPHRDLSLYPLDEAKVEKLRSSISRTDFWGNVVARERNGCYELAYGHHRIEAARRALGKAASVPIIVLELDDAYMLQMMAADNDDAYAIMPGFILEVVRAAKSFVGKEKVSCTGAGKTCIACCGDHLCCSIHAFLDWPSRRVGDALRQLNAIEDNKLSEEAVKILPTPKAAEAFRKQVIEAKIPVRQQARYARSVAEEISENSSASAAVTKVFTPLLSSPGSTKKVPDVSQFAVSVSVEIVKMLRDGDITTKKLNDIIKFREHLPVESSGYRSLTISLRKLSERAQEYLNQLEIKPRLLRERDE
jgi:ParB-like chromosome segregation protein Spo0J